MAEILVRVHNKAPSADPYTEVKQSKRGDVIAVCPDGWKWSPEELKNPVWRIVKVVGLDSSVAQQLLMEEDGDRRVNRMLRRRKYKLDVDFASLPQAGKDYLRDDTREQPMITISKAMAQNLVTLKEPVQDPAVIG